MPNSIAPAVTAAGNPRAVRALTSAVIALLAAVAGILAGGAGGADVTVNAAPAMVARLDSVDARLALIEARLSTAEKVVSEGAGLAAAVGRLSGQLDLLLSLDTRRLDGGDQPARRGR